MNRQQIENLKVGDFIEICHDTAWGKLQPGARWSKPKKVVEIFARGVSEKGHAYVCGYTELDEHARISFSCDETEEGYQTLEEAPAERLMAQYYDLDLQRAPLTPQQWDAIRALDKELGRRGLIQPAFWATEKEANDHLADD